MELSSVKSITLEEAFWNDPCLFNTDVSWEVAGLVKVPSFTPGLIFGDLVLSIFAELVKPVKPPIDCVPWRAFLNCSCIFPSWAGLLEGNSCFARSFLVLGASYSLAARPNIALAIEVYVHLQLRALNAVSGGQGERGAFLQLASTDFVAEEQIGRTTGPVVIQSKAPLGNG